jgi:hypothetical protein
MLASNIGDYTYIKTNFETELLLYDPDIRSRIEGRFNISCWRDGRYYTTRNFPQLSCEPKLCSPLFTDYHGYQYAAVVQRERRAMLGNVVQNIYLRNIFSNDGGSTSTIINLNELARHPHLLNYSSLHAGTGSYGSSRYENSHYTSLL